MPAAYDHRLTMQCGDSAARDDVIAHWRTELVAAEEAEQAGGQRPWLARMRVRLYRFLLACYAAGPWGAQSQEAEGEAESLPDALSLETARLEPRVSGESVANDDQPYFSPPVAWTHVRAPGKIAAVLKAVAGAQEPHVAGPLVLGIEPDGWVTLAAASSHVDLQRLARILKHNGIEGRVRKVGDDSILEVRACDRGKATYWLGVSAAELRTKFNLRSNGAPMIVEVLFLGFVLGLGGIPLIALVLPLLRWWILGRTPGPDDWRLTPVATFPAGMLVAVGLFCWSMIRIVRWRDSIMHDRPVRTSANGK
jgi:hypothetical protein